MNSKSEHRNFTDWKGLIYNVAFFLNGLLIFLLLFESRFSVPYWMQTIGRMHPLVLHFPIVALMLYGFWVLLVEKENSARWNAGLADTLLLIGTLTAVVAAFSGFVLSKEEGYEADTLYWHKWTGISISLSSIIWYSIPRFLPPWKIPAKILAGAFLFLLFAAGHLGGNLTHGEDFLLSPIKPTETVQPIAFEDANVYKDLVQPVLNKKCLSCHNEEKSKGGLQMQTQALLTKGGKNGILWDTTQADLGLLLKRVHLPIDDKKHMPPKGKVQLSDEEIVLLAEWVKGGSRFDQSVRSLPAQHPVYTYAQHVLGGNRIEEQYTFDAADAEEIKKLNTTYRLVKPLSTDSPALFVNFYNRANFTSKEISDLLPLKNQVVSMDLSKMPVKDEDLKLLAQFPALRKLILNFTDINGPSLVELKKLPQLKELSLSGTAVQVSHVKALSDFPALRKVFVWSTGLTPNELAVLKKDPKITYETGFRSDTLILALNPPIIENENPIITSGGTVTMKHKIPGAVIRYTLDGTDPDSINAIIYNKPLVISKNTKLKARAYKNGWYGSQTVDKYFFKAGYHADSVWLVKAADVKYPAKGAKTLVDRVKSGREQGSGNWLGFRDTDFQGYLLFKKPVKASSVAFSMLRNIGGYIFPPVRIEVWGGNDEKSLKLLKVIKPEMPVKETPNSDILVFEADFPSQELRCLKLVAVPLSKLPPWHPGKGEKAWIFVDEVFVN
jgi:mono/diheme cytochrome c family protein/uncharacterized membrane protein